MIGDDKDFCKKSLHLNLSDKDTKRVWFRAAMQAAVVNHSAAERAFHEHPRSRRNTEGSLNVDSLLSHGEITGDFATSKITTTETPFLPVQVYSAAESSTVTYFVRKPNKEAATVQVKCSWNAICPRSTANANIVHF